MDTTIRNLDAAAYRKLKAHAAASRRTIGEAVSDAIRAYLARADTMPKTRSLLDLTPEPYAAGNERLSEEIDAIVYQDRA